MTEFATIRSSSASVSDYLKAVWKLARASPDTTVSTKEISERLCVTSASVSNMFSRLQEMGLVNYVRYHGVSLTDRGCAEALRLVRRHRLIETFLMEHLAYSWQDVHEEAERLEHAVSDNFTERLAEFLGRPAHDPHGDPIPKADGTLPPENSRPLSDVEAGLRVRISKVSDNNASMLAHLGERGLVPGRLLKVTEVRTLDGVVTVEDEDGNLHSLGEPLAHSVYVRASGLGMESADECVYD